MCTSSRLHKSKPLAARRWSDGRLQKHAERSGGRGRVTLEIIEVQSAVTHCVAVDELKRLMRGPSTSQRFRKLQMFGARPRHPIAHSGVCYRFCATPHKQYRGALPTDSERAQPS